MSADKRPGFLIAIEGIDGAGKTTQAHFVQEKLQALGISVVLTKEPTTGKWGQILRDSAVTGRLSAEEEIETFVKDRTEHVKTLIKPSLEGGEFVIIDRYYFSTMAYQGARGWNPEKLREQNEAFAPEPDLLVLLDIDPDSGLKRIRMRGDRANHFEQNATLAKCREIFNGIDKPYLLKIDANQPIETIRDLIVDEIKRRYTIKLGSNDLSPRDAFEGTLNLFGKSLNE